MSLERLECPTVIEHLPTLPKVKIYRYTGMGAFDVLVQWFANEYLAAVSPLDLVICLGDFHGAIRKIIADVLAFVHVGLISHGLLFSVRKFGSHEEGLRDVAVEDNFRALLLVNEHPEVYIFSVCGARTHNKATVIEHFAALPAGD